MTPNVDTLNKGIHYARATRLASRARPDSWKLLWAGAFGPAAPQPPRTTGEAVFGPTSDQAEQCLTSSGGDARHDANAHGAASAARWRRSQRAELGGVDATAVASLAGRDDAERTR